MSWYSLFEDLDWLTSKVDVYEALKQLCQLPFVNLPVTHLGLSRNQTRVSQMGFHHLNHFVIYLSTD